MRTLKLLKASEVTGDLASSKRGKRGKESLTEKKRCRRGPKRTRRAKEGCGTHLRAGGAEEHHRGPVGCSTAPSPGMPRAVPEDYISRHAVRAAAAGVTLGAVFLPPRAGRRFGAPSLRSGRRLLQPFPGDSPATPRLGATWPRSVFS